MPTILIVDDDDAIRGILYDLLSEKYECDTASMAEQALQFLDCANYDLVLTDVSMPGLSGIELLTKIQDRGLTTPVILITGKGGEADGRILLGLGAFAYITKPFSLDEIETNVERALAGK